MNSFAVSLLNIGAKLFDNEFNDLNTLFHENKDEYDSDKSFDEETLPDEDFNKYAKKRDKIMSCPNVDKTGPNINLKLDIKRYSNQKEKEFFFDKIKRKKKTELCKNYELYHDCYYKNECSFAHGIEELREKRILPCYKTKLCKSFINKKVCNFGIRCSYKHSIK